jgi:hypothetical protein
MIYQDSIAFGQGTIGRIGRSAELRFFGNGLLDIVKHRAD